MIESQAINKKAMLASCENAAAMDKPCKASMQRLLKAAKKSPSAKELVNTVEHAKAKTKACEKAEAKKTVKKMHKHALKSC